MSLPRQGHDTTASFKTRAPGSFKRLLGGACVDGHTVATLASSLFRVHEETETNHKSECT